MARPQQKQQFTAPSWLSVNVRADSSQFTLPSRSVSALTGLQLLLLQFPLGGNKLRIEGGDHAL